MNPYRNENEAIQMKMEALTIENNDLRQELERLQSLFDNKNNAIIMCPIDNDEDEDDGYKPDSRDETLRKIGIFLTAVQGCLFFGLLTGSFIDKDYLYAAILSAFFINVVAGIAFLYSRQSWR
jgi:hypothetical protein